MEQKKKETEATYWHPAFYADIQIELKDDADNLIFENEHQLGKKPMEIDVLIIKKAKNRPVKKNIGKIFRKHNIIEYKGPGDSLSVDDFYKVYGYTCFYKSDVSYVNKISVKELTITFVSEAYPRKLIQHLKNERNYEVEMIEKGIYSVKGDIIPIQIIVTRKLSAEKNLWLKSLTNNLKTLENTADLIVDYLEHKQNYLYEAVFETIIRANRKLFEEVNSMSVKDAIMELFPEKVEQTIKEEAEKAVATKFAKEIEKEVAKKVAKEVEKEVAKKVEKEVAKEVEKEVAKEVAVVKKELQNEVEAAKMEAKAARLTERISLIRKKCVKNKPLTVIADELETDEDELLSLYNIICENPEKTADEIYTLFAG